MRFEGLYHLLSHVAVETANGGWIWICSIHKFPPSLRINQEKLFNPHFPTNKQAYRRSDALKLVTAVADQSNRHPPAGV